MALPLIEILRRHHGPALIPKHLSNLYGIISRNCSHLESPCKLTTVFKRALPAVDLIDSAIRAGFTDPSSSTAEIRIRPVVSCRPLSVLEQILLGAFAKLLIRMQAERIKNRCETLAKVCLSELEYRCDGLAPHPLYG